ncbi:MAG TPA: amidinotransferase [Burkholderiales bacterium]|nr:amidinotransferase [Burkholderiales bacterium]
MPTPNANDARTCPVNSHNEWDPLEEVIVGDLTNATVPADHAAAICGLPRAAAALQPLFAGFRYPGPMLREARRELESFVSLLEAQGARVRRPDPRPFHRRFATPAWSSRGYACASPRDALLVIGSEIIEAPMSWRSRYFEIFAYRRLLREYFAAGAAWTSAPKPELRDELFAPDHPRHGAKDPFVVREGEPIFDAADVVRCGRDLFAMRCNTANRAGIEWLRRHLGPRGYRVHEIPVRDPHAMHIDHHFIPLAPGKALVNAQRVALETLPAVLKSWEIRAAPPSDRARAGRFPRVNACTRWLNVNVLSLDEHRVVVAQDEPSMIRALESWGFEPIP